MVQSAGVQAPGVRSRRARTARRRAPLWADLSLLAVIGVVLAAALAAGGLTVYREFYSPAAFVTRYLTLLSEGRAADALRVPGVALEHADLDSDAFRSASDALLRRDALSSLTDISVTDEHADGDATAVTVRYTAGGHAGATTFRVRQDGWIGVAPAWEFAQSPLAVISLTVRGSDRFSVNGFELDRRQVAAKGAESSPLEPVPMLVFSPGLYSVSVRTAAATAAGMGVLADKPLADVPLDVQATPTAAFVKVVQQRVDEFLARCTTQQVLQPTGCPFGLTVSNMVTHGPTWSMVSPPHIALEPDADGWKITPAPATVHVALEVKSLYDGSVAEVDKNVPFEVDGTIRFLPDGSASISITSPEQSPTPPGSEG
ncbi:MAG: hypothetical protein JST33_04375 [Actinobacteria bacterium]|nr:hypothetical protein [Actinomycetota bacterium]